MADYGKRVKSGDQHLANLTGGNWLHIDGSSSSVIVVPVNIGTSLLRVINNAKGLSLNIRSGVRVVGTLATTSVENTYDYGVYCNSGIQIDVSGTGSATVVFG